MAQFGRDVLTVFSGKENGDGFTVERGARALQVNIHARLMWSYEGDDDSTEEEELTPASLRAALEWLEGETE